MEKSLDLHSLSNIRKSNINRFIRVHININSVRNKFDQLVDGFKGKINVLMISETQIDDSFPTMHFMLEDTVSVGYDEFGSGILVYVQEGIPSKFRSSLSEVFLGKGVLKICSKFTGEHPCQSAMAWVFSCKFAAYFQNTFSQEHLRGAASVNSFQ